jgi:nucleoside-diphosphate-sugar epimerase
VRQGKVPVLGDGSDIMPWTHVDNVTHAIGLALDRSESIGRAYNVVDGDVAWRDFIEDMRSWFPDAPPAPIIPAETAKSGDKFIGHCPNDRMVTELNYKPVRTYFEGMAEAGAWWKKNAGKV